MQNDRLAREVGARLVRQRILRDYSQQKVKDILHSPSLRLSDYEAGKRLPSLLVLMELAAVYDVGVEELLPRPMEISTSCIPETAGQE